MHSMIDLPKNENISNETNKHIDRMDAFYLYLSAI